MMKVVVTGANGFIGRSVTSALLSAGDEVCAVMRTQYPDEGTQNLHQIIIPGLDINTDWTPYLSGVDAIVHCAARAHVMNDNEEDPAAAFKKINTNLTLNLAHQAAKAGIKRFIFLSTIKVNGEQTLPAKPFTEQFTGIPTDPYAFSKWEAEQGLMAISKQTNMEVVIIRPPVVYGFGVKGNFAAMIKWIKRGIPLPFGSISNQRSVLAVDNLVNFIQKCLKHPKAANQIFLIADEVDISTPVLLKMIAKSMNQRIWLVPIPVGWLKFIAKLVGKEGITERLLGTLQIDASKAKNMLSWHPNVSIEEQLKKMVKDE